MQTRIFCGFIFFGTQKNAQRHLIDIVNYLFKILLQNTDVTDKQGGLMNTCVRARELGYQVLTSLDTMYTKPEFPNDANEDWYKKYTHLVSVE